METVVTPFQNKLLDLLEKYDKEIMAGKRRTFHRDKLDFKTQHAFKWRHRANRRMMRDNSTHNQEATSSGNDLTSRIRR